MNYAWYHLYEESKKKKETNRNREKMVIATAGGVGKQGEDI